MERQQKELEQTRREQLVPVLTMRLDQEKLGLFLKNDGNGHAKDICIDDFDINLSYTFKKIITLKSEPILLLKPDEEIPLIFGAFDHGLELPSNNREDLFAHMTGASFEANVRYTNIENKPFHAIIAKKDNHIYNKETLPS